MRGVDDDHSGESFPHEEESLQDSEMREVLLDIIREREALAEGSKQHQVEGDNEDVQDNEEQAGEDGKVQIDEADLSADEKAHIRTSMTTIHMAAEGLIAGLKNDTEIKLLGKMQKLQPSFKASPPGATAVSFNSSNSSELSSATQRCDRTNQSPPTDMVDEEQGQETHPGKGEGENGVGDGPSPSVQQEEESSPLPDDTASWPPPLLPGNSPMPGALAMPGIYRQDTESIDDGIEFGSSTLSEEDLEQPTQPEENEMAMAEAELVDDTEMEQLRQHADAYRQIPVAAIDEQADKRRLKRNVKAAIVVALVLAVGLSLGLRFGLKSDPIVIVKTRDEPFSGTNFTLAGLEWFDTAAEQSGFWEWLKEYSDANQYEGNYTILAPTDESFGKTRIDYLSSPATNGNYKVHIRTVLMNQVFFGRVNFTEVTESKNITTLTGREYQATNTIATTADSSSLAFSPAIHGSGAVQELDLVPEPGFVVHSMEGFLSIGLLFKNAVEVSLENGLDQAVDWVSYSGLLLFLEEISDYTIFLPSNEAFEKVPLEIREAVRADREAVLTCVLNHGHTPLLYSEDFTNMTLNSLDGNKLRMHVDADGTTTLSANEVSGLVIKTDLLPYNGVLHVVDAWFCPEEVYRPLLSKEV